MYEEPDGEHIRQLRNDRGLTRHGLAKRVGCSDKTIENIERGKRVLNQTLALVAKGLDVELRSLRAGNVEDGDDPAQTSMSMPLLGSVPPLPPLVVGRDIAIQELKKRLARPVLGDNPARVVVVHGWAGVGKSTIAAVLTRDADLATVFSDGVLWTSVGPEPKLLNTLHECGRALGTEAIRQAKSVKEATGMLAAQLREKRMLVVVDDVWHEEDFQAFRFAGRQCATLVTTRRTAVAERLSPTPDDSYNLEVLDEASALELLRRLTPDVVAKHTEECRELVKQVERLPLAIEVAGKLLNRHYQRWEESGVSSVAKLLRELRDASRLLQEQAPANMVGLLEETTPTVAALLQKSTDYLDDDTRERFAYLGGFVPKPAVFDLDSMALAWQVDETEAKRGADKLMDHGLLAPTNDGYFWIHALVASHARTLCD